MTKDGEVFVPQSAEDIATTIIDNLNERLAVSNLRSEAGDIVQIDKKASNIAWLLALAVGGVGSDYEYNLQSCAESLDFTLCSDEQIQNLLPLCGQYLGGGKKSIITVYATNGNPSGGDTITINAGTLLTLAGVDYAVNETVTVDPQEEQGLECTAVEVGRVDYVVGDSVSFKNSSDKPENCTLTLNSFSQGVDDRSISDARNRLLNYKQQTSGYLGVEEQIRNLSWVKDCFVVYNFSFTSSLAVGGLSIPARKAAIFIYGGAGSDGDKEELANIWLSNMMIDTYAGDNTESLPYVQYSYYPDEMSYQSFPIKYYECIDKDFYVKVKILQDETTDIDTFKLYITQELIDYSSTFSLGYTITSSFMDRAFDDKKGTVIDTLVSLDGTTFSDSISMYPYWMPRLLEANISFEVV